MLGHEDVTEDLELVPCSELFEDCCEGGAGVIVVEVRAPPMATEGDEVVMAFGLVTFEAAWHGVRLTDDG